MLFEEVCGGWNRFMVHIREEFGEKHEIVIQGLLEHGRLRMDQLIEYAAPRMNDTPEQARATLTGNIHAEDPL